MPSPAATTPLMEQYERVRAQYPDHIVLFRVGDFFETFGDDARRLSRELEIVLTSRSPDAAGTRIPMAGVPHHALESYLARLVRKGYRVAICDQVEDARLAKGLVRREVTRVVTPGTVVEERILGGAEHNFLAAVTTDGTGTVEFAAVDITTGEWFRGRARAPGPEPAVTALAPFSPSEMILEATNAPAGPLELALRAGFPRARLGRPASGTAPPAAAPVPSESASAADRLLADYVAATQPRLLPFLELAEKAPVPRLVLDARTLRHLEVTRPMNPDDPSGPTLVGTWDETVTAPGGRTLAFWLRTPLADRARIEARLDAVDWLRARGAGLLELRDRLRPIADLARVASRLAGRRVRPPELASLRDGLAAAAELERWLDAAPGELLVELRHRLAPIPELAGLLGRALPEQPPPTTEHGGLFRPGFDPALDGLHQAEREGLAELERLEHEELAAFGGRGVKLGYNQVFGYYFEVTRPNLARVPPHFRRKQTLSGAERFTTEALAEAEAKILGARDRRSDEEAAAWERFLQDVERFVPAVHRLSRAIGELDALASFAITAQERRLVRPVLDESRELQIREGRHPVLDRLLEGRFVPNDTDLDGGGARLWVLTGPNMAGKSTYMRQVGLIVLLAQCGSFVPAKFARIGLVNALHTRMGFTDEIGHGKSSFMVEMSEVAEILRAADDRSLVLLDEVGRGTSTFDGLALAWATLRHLCDRTRCRTILATHYHQLTELIEGLDGARNAHMAVQESEGEIAFLHRLVLGSTDRSYGLHVARLAGLPGPLLADAQRLLTRLESETAPLPAAAGGRAGARYTQAVLLPAPPARESAVEAALRGLDPEQMTPMEALRWVEEWRRRLVGEAGSRPAE